MPFSSYAEAVKVCTLDAYQNQELVEVIFRKTKACVQSMHSGQYAIDATSAFSSIALLNIASSNDTINVIDLGGACGLHYFSARLMLPTKTRISWRVVETTAMAQRAKELENDELKFFDNLDSAVKDLNRIDLIFTSGTLQCVPDPYDMLKKIIAARAPLIMFARCCFVQKPDDLIVNHRSMLSWHGKGDMPTGFVDKEMTYPFTFMSLEKFIREITKEYELILKLEDTSGVFPVDDEPVLGLGLLFQIKK